MASKLSRREFINRSAAGTVAAAAALRAPLGFTAPPDSPNARIQLGIIGVGARVQSGLLEAAMAVPGVAVGGGCDGYRGRVEPAVARTGRPAQDYRGRSTLLPGQSDVALVI